MRYCCLNAISLFTNEAYIISRLIILWHTMFYNVTLVAMWRVTEFAVHCQCVGDDGSVGDQGRTNVYHGRENTTKLVHHL